MRKLLPFPLHTLPALILAAVMLVVTAGPAAAAAGFGDVDDDAYYADAVGWMVSTGITTGTEPGCFGPDEMVTRGQVAAFVFRLDRAVGNDPAVAAHPFVDVVLPYQDEPIGWMFAAGVTTGTSPVTFSPGARVTRGDFATLLWRYAGEPEAPGHEFGDVDLRYQQAAVSWMASEGITRGTSPTRFDPHSAMTRAEAAAFLFRYADPAEVPQAVGGNGCARSLRAALVTGGLTPDEAACAAPWLTDFTADHLERVAFDLEPASPELVLAVASLIDRGCLSEQRMGELSRIYL